jgi:DNA-binding MarR family transcriptional regulator
MYLLNQANQAVRSQFEAALRDLQMTGIQYTVLTIVDEYEGISSAELSRRFFVTAQTMNEIINGLVQRGFIARKEDPSNKRILRMKLTAAGRRLLKKCETCMNTKPCARACVLCCEDCVSANLHSLFDLRRAGAPALEIARLRAPHHDFSPSKSETQTRRSERMPKQQPTISSRIISSGSIGGLPMLL